MAPAVDMFQRNKDKLFQGLPNVLCIADDILIVGFDDIQKYHDTTLGMVLRICREANLKINKYKYFSDLPTFPFLEKSHSGMV